MVSFVLLLMEDLRQGGFFKLGGLGVDSGA